METHRIAHCRLLAAGVVSLIVLGLSACAAEDKKSSTAVESPSGIPTPGQVTAGSAAAVPGGGFTSKDVSLVDAAPQGSTSAARATGSGSAADVVLPAVAPFGDALAITAAVTVEVPDVRKAVVGLPAIVEGKGGAIYNTDIQVGDPKTATAMITIKVPPADLERMISGLNGVGAIVSRTQQTEDVSTQITDVNVRILTAQASVERIRALLKDAKSLQDVTSIESELTNRETTLEQLLAQQRNLGDRVQLATLTATLTPISDTAIADAQAKPAKPQTVSGAWHDGWSRFTKIAHGVGVACAYAIPFLVLGAMAGLIGWFIRRRNLHSAARQSGPTISEAGA
jgi:hypothetical protein